jgi:hypothetical protein
MLFRVIWLDGFGKADYAEHFENVDFLAARRFCCSKMIRMTVPQHISGFVLDYADSEFIRRHTQTVGAKKRVAHPVELEEVMQGFEHLRKE